MKRTARNSAPESTFLAGKWDARDQAAAGMFRCRWFFSWTDFGSGRIIGFFAGYEGGGAFVEERFHARFRGARLQEFVWNGRDHATGTDRSFEPIPDEVERCQDQHFDVFLSWHDEAEWERGFLCLAAGREQGLTRLPGSLLLAPTDDECADRVAAMVRCTGILTRF